MKDYTFPMKHKYLRLKAIDKAPHWTHVHTNYCKLLQDISRYFAQLLTFGQCCFLRW